MTLEEEKNTETCLTAVLTDGSLWVDLDKVEIGYPHAFPKDLVRPSFGILEDDDGIFDGWFDDDTHAQSQIGCPEGCYDPEYRLIPRSWISR